MIPFGITGGAIKTAGLGLCVASILALGFWGGFRWQAGNVADAERAREKAEAQREKAQGERDQWQQNAMSYQTAIQQQRDSNEAAIRAANAQKAKAAKAEAEARAEKDRYEKKIAEVKAAIERDKLDPGCKAELERKVCGSPWE